MGRLGLAIAAAALVLIASAVTVRAEQNGDGDLLVAFDGGITPKELPRSEPAPVAIKVAGDVRSASGSPDSLPQLRTISVAINRQGRLFDRGLPVCRLRGIRSANEATALRNCAGAVVGSGRVTVRLHIRTQPPFEVGAKVLAFNGPRRNGAKLIFVQAYAREPPGSLVLVFRVTRQPGLFGTVLATRLPARARDWAFLTHFELTLYRTYRWRGKERSFVSASCSAPAGFSSVLFPLARATYGFDDGRSLATSVSRTCRVVP